MENKQTWYVAVFDSYPAAGSNSALQTIYGGDHSQGSANQQVSCVVAGTCTVGGLGAGLPSEITGPLTTKFSGPPSHRAPPPMAPQISTKDT
ncbi:hypothetical protein XENTR_v10007620 [Xenopus tropicalis]|nr:hypothetical protein XENTR_v10007620 [Xenopus tropicalis]